MTFGTQGKFPTTFVRLLHGFDKRIFAAAHIKAVNGWLQISAACVKMNVEEVFISGQTWKKRVMNVIVVVRVR